LLYLSTIKDSSFFLIATNNPYPHFFLVRTVAFYLSVAFGLVIGFVPIQ